MGAVQIDRQRWGSEAECWDSAASVLAGGAPLHGRDVEAEAKGERGPAGLV